MATLVLPTRTDLARYSFTCDLDSVTYSFSFEWNDRDSGWYMSIGDVNGAPLLSGARVVLGYLLTAIHRAQVPTLPPGDLVAFDTSTTDTEPGLGDLGDRVILAYVSVT